MKEQAFRVDVVLANEMVEPTRPLLLDSLLEELAAGRLKYQCKRPVELPLAVARSEEGWCYKASAFAWRVAWRDQCNITRKLDVGKMVQDGQRGLVDVRSKPNLGVGPHRNYLLAYPVIGLQEPASAYGVGDIAAVRELLSRCSHLGGKRRLGHGRIASLDVVAIEDDAAWMWRPLPWAHNGYVPCVAAVTPPYFRRDRRMQAYAPAELA